MTIPRTPPEGPNPSDPTPCLSELPDGLARVVRRLGMPGAVASAQFGLGRALALWEPAAAASAQPARRSGA